MLRKLRNSQFLEVRPILPTLAHGRSVLYRLPGSITMNALTVPRNERCTPEWMLTNYDRETTLEPDLDTELKRLTVLRTFPLLSRAAAQETDPDFEMLAELAMSLLEAPMACIKLADMLSIRVAASAGSWPKTLQEIRRKESFCAHTIQNREGVLVVKDALKDARFRNFPQVKGPPFVRFYAGVALVSSEGARVGSVCVFDSRPRPGGLSDEQFDHMKELSSLVIDMMEQTRSMQGKRNPKLGTEWRQRSHVLHSNLPSSALFSENDHHAPFDRQCGSTCQPIPRHLHRSSTIFLPVFLRGLKIAMQSFPKRVELQFCMHPSCPLKFNVPNDLPVFRSALAILTSACERTNSGYIRLTVRSNQDHIVFECEDTGPYIDSSLSIFDSKQLLPPMTTDDEIGCLDLKTCLEGAKKGLVCMPPKRTGPATDGLSLNAVRAFMSELGGQYGFERRKKSDGYSGSIVWFSFPVETGNSHI